MPSASASEGDARDFTVAAFNAHWGVGRYQGPRGVRFDVARVVRGLDADVVVVPESWRDAQGAGLLDELCADGYHVETVRYMRLELRVRTAATERGRVPYDGAWELAVCSRFPLLGRRLIPMGVVGHDPVGPRDALAVTVDVAGTPVEVVGLHTSSKVWKLGGPRHVLGLRRGLHAGGPQVLAGDFNFWGPPLRPLLRGWKPAVRGRTFPSSRPHSQIDHVFVRGGIEVRGGEVLAATPSDHRPIRARLRLRSDAPAPH